MANEFRTAKSQTVPHTPASRTVNSPIGRPLSIAQPQITRQMTTVPGSISLASGGPAPASGGGGGGGGSGAATAAAAPPPMSLEDFIQSNFLFTSQKNENERSLEDFDAETMRLQQETEADQTMRRGALSRRLDDAGQANAEDMAGRGLLRSGMTFENQDRIEEEGVEQENVIAQLLSNLIGQRGQGRVNQQAQNRSALNDRIAQITDQFNQKQTAAF